MKRDLLQELLASGKEQKDIIDEIMNINGQDIEQARANVKVDETKWVAKTTFDELQAQHTNLVNEHSAYKQSTQDYEEIKTNYNNLLQQQETTRKVDLLKGLKCKHPELLVDKFDWSKVDFEKKEVETEYLTTFKGKYTDLFEVEETLYKPQQVRKPLGTQNPNDKKWTNEDLQNL